MGKKNRARKTKWRQISLDNSSSQEEDLDEQQQQQHPQHQLPEVSDEQSQQRHLAEETATKSDERQEAVETLKDVQGYRQRRPHPFRHHPSNQQTTVVRHTTFNDEEYTKISTPRQEVLLKKGFIGNRKSNVTSSGHKTTSDDNEDLNKGNGVEVVSDVAGTEVSSPVYCYPNMVPYGNYYPQGIIMQELYLYPGGPLVAAMPVSLPMQPVYPVYYGGEQQTEYVMNERVRKSSGDSSQASGSVTQDGGSSENSESSSPEPLSPGFEVPECVSAMESPKVEPVLQYPSFVYVYPAAGYAFPQPVYTNG